MRVIDPIDIIGNNELLASSLPENDYPVYDPATPYTQGQKVTDNNLNYEALSDSVDKYPSDTPLVWHGIGVTNRAAPFDEKIGTKAISTDPISYQLRPLALVNTIALLSVQALSVSVTMTDAVAGLVYQRTIEMSDSAVEDWYEYFFAKYENKEVAIFDDLPAYAGSVIDIVITPVSTAEVGTIVVGSYDYLGDERWGMSLGITDYSKKRRDEFGNVFIQRRPYSSKVNVTLELPSMRVDVVHRTLSRLRSKSALYLSADGYESSYVYGFYNDFNVVLDSFAQSICSLELEGLI